MHADCTINLLSGGVCVRSLPCHLAILPRSPFFAAQLRWLQQSRSCPSAASTPRGSPPPPPPPLPPPPPAPPSPPARGALHSPRAARGGGAAAAGAPSPPPPLLAALPPAAAAGAPPPPIHTFTVELGDLDSSAGGGEWSLARGDAGAVRGTMEARAQALEEALRWMYGHAPQWDAPGHHLASALAVASYLDLPELLQSAADNTFASLRAESVVDALLAVWGREYGDAGQLIETAAVAFLYRNAVDVGPSQLSRLPEALLARVLTAPELWVRSEMERVGLVCATLRAARARLLAQVCAAAPSALGEALAPDSFLRADGAVILGAASSRVRGAIQMFAAAVGLGGGAGAGAGGGSGSASSRSGGVPPPPPPSLRSRCSAPPPSAPPSPRAFGRSFALEPPAAALSPFAEPPAAGSDGYGAWGGSGGSAPASPHGAGAHAAASSAAVASLSDVHVAGEGAAGRAGAHAPRAGGGGGGGGGGGAAHRGAEYPAEPPAASASLIASTLIAAAEALIGVGGSLVGGAGPGGGGGGSAEPTAARYTPRGGSPGPASGVRCGGADGCGGAAAPSTPAQLWERLEALEAAFLPAFRACHLQHLSCEQLAEAEASGDVPGALVEAARAAAARRTRRLEQANVYNVRRLTELSAVDAAAAEGDFKWPPLRFGLELKGVYAAGMTPTSEVDPRSLTTERVAALGSCWSLDAKRFIAGPAAPEVGEAVPGQEYLAVYLRRRVLAAPPGAFLDTRERTTVAFSIRLCGAPASPTSNSVCGRSNLGKPFGLDGESSWGWETFLSSQSLADRTTWANDALRFLVNLDFV